MIEGRVSRGNARVGFPKSAAGERARHSFRSWHIWPSPGGRLPRAHRLADLDRDPLHLAPCRERGAVRMMGVREVKLPAIVHPLGALK